MKKYLTFYKACIKTKKIPFYGLCRCFPNDNYLILFYPHGQLTAINNWYWGIDGNYFQNRHVAEKLKDKFTPLRQTIVLFLAAMNGEL